MADDRTATPQKTAGYMNSSHKNKNQDRIAREEEELRELEAQMAEGKDQPEEEETPEVKEPEAKEPETAEEKSFKKRYGDLRRHMQEKEAKWKEREQELQAQLENGGQDIRPPASDEDLAAWKAKYPDVAGIVETMAMKIADEKFKEAKMSLDDLRQTQEEGKIEKGIAAIRKAHSDFDELNESDEFHTWLEEQTQWIQDAMYENVEDPKAAIRVLDLYKADKGLTPSARKERDKEAVQGVKAKSRPDPDADNASRQWRESTVKKMNDKDFEKNYDAIMKAMADGNFIYDLTGGAR